MQKIYPVILAGGFGTRLWPLSRAALPKQLMPIFSEKTMLQETVFRMKNRAAMMQPLVICGEEHRFLVAEQLREIGIDPLGIILEPEGRNTAPAVAVAAHFLEAVDANAMMLVLPADHVVEEVDAFHALVDQAAPLANQGELITFGIVPDSAETCYGYIKRGEKNSGDNIGFKVKQFFEKPSQEKAEALLSSDDYLWNSGMFLLRADSYLSELKKVRPKIADASEEALNKSYRDLHFCRLNEAAFLSCSSESIDHAVMEYTEHASVVPVSIGWSDVGSWSALWAAQKKTADGNVCRGDTYLDGVKNSLVRAESRCVAVIGLENIVVIETADAVLVARKDDVQRVEKVVSHLKAHDRTEHINHTRVYRPWGSYQGIDLGDRFQVKRITVNPGGKLSLQMHHHRAEHWIVVSGTAKVTCGDKVSLLTENESTYIPIGMNHRLENPGKQPLHLIEVQSGGYLGEDDIVRFEDVYQRA